MAKNKAQQEQILLKNSDINIFRSFHDVNLNTIVGYHNDKMHYNFLDDYDEKIRKE